MTLPRAHGRAVADGGIVRPILLMALSALLFASMHAMIRQVSTLGLHAFEIAFFRCLFGLLFVVPWFVRYGLQPLRTERLGLHVLRTALNVVAMLSFFYALTVTPLAEVTALSFTAPIFATLLAGLVLGELVGTRRWSAVSIGFLGMLLILRPGFAEIGHGQLFALLSSLAWASALMVIKTLSRTESSVTIITYMALLLAPASLVPALFVWEWPTPEQLLWLAVIGLIGGGAQYLMTEALAGADTSLVMPVDFTKLIWVSAIAYVAFGEIPDGFTWLGGAIIFASTVYITYREQRARPSKPAG